jgi:hypothetical protein
LDHLGMGNTMVETDALTGNISLSVDWRICSFHVW